MFRKRLVLVAVFTLLFNLPVIAQEQGAEGTKTENKKNKVVLMGMIHSGHKTSTAYDLDKVKKLIRDVKPDFVFCEIPPDRVEEANRQYQQSGKITESRVKVFPEYVDALYPLTKELEFEIVPCAGWTKAMADARREKMAELKTTHQTEYQEMEQAQDKATKSIGAAGGNDNPEYIHTDAFDAFVKAGMEPYNRHFNDILGPGGWENINKAHYGLIDKNLDARTGQGKTILIMFGTWHKYWFKEQLRKRDDIELINLNTYLKSK